jgi:hypothetical protein
VGTGCPGRGWGLYCDEMGDVVYRARAQLSASGLNAVRRTAARRRARARARPSLWRIPRLPPRFSTVSSRRRATSSSGRAPTKVRLLVLSLRGMGGTSGDSWSGSWSWGQWGNAVVVRRWFGGVFVLGYSKRCRKWRGRDCFCDRSGGSEGNGGGEMGQDSGFGTRTEKSFVKAGGNDVEVFLP